MEQNYDVLVIGGGQAGIPLALALAGQGRQVVLAERQDLGGSCVNYGCTPTKAVLASAQLAHQARRASEYGLRIPQVEVDFPAVLQRAREIVQESRQGLDKSMAGDNPRLLRGEARLQGRADAGFRVQVGAAAVIAKEVVLNTGAHTLLPPLPGLREVPFLTAENWLAHDQLPAHVVVIGGGYIGMEMGQFYRRMGSQVTVIEPSAEVLGHEDRLISSALRGFLEAEGITFCCHTKIERIAGRDGQITLSLKQGEQVQELSASHLFLATGREPSTAGLGLDTVGVARNEHGVVKVDERLATNVPSIWAAGDIRGGPQFTHTSWDDYRILLSQMAGDRSRTTKRIVPYAVFTDPELGRVGQTEKEARDSGRPVLVSKYEMKKNGKAREIGETNGFIQVVADAETHQILGAAVLGAHASELVHLYVDLMNARASYTVLRDAVHIHPTLAEAVQSAVASLEK